MEFLEVSFSAALDVLIKAIFMTTFRYLRITRLNELSVTRLGDFLHFGQTFKAAGNKYFTQIAHIVRQFL